MGLRRIIVSLSLLVGLALLVPGLPAFSRPTGATVDPTVLADTAGGQTASVVVYLASQADVGSAAVIHSRSERGRFVYRTLSAHANKTQAPLTHWLNARGIAYQSFWVASMLVLDADRSLVDQLASRVDVARIDSNRPSRWIEDAAVADPTSESGPTTATGIEPGVLNIRAPDVWNLGYTGTGIVIGDADTGVRWTHAALKTHYRGWNGSAADHNYNWHDAIHSGGGVCGPNTAAPCDDNGHGTHTAGTLVGDDGSVNQIGVAPGSKWIGCRNMDQGSGTPATYSECFQFFLAPTDLAGNNPNPDLRPDIISNSWACPPSEGCTTGAELTTILSNLTAAGIFVVAAAGNYGPNCSTVQYPLGMYSDALSVGAIDASNNSLASFSSRGPSLYYNPPLLKPEISAPGVNVRSAYRTSDTAYATISGTSMATPHVAGAVALLWSARPELRGDIAGTRATLLNSANPQVTVDPPERCGNTNSWDLPNNSFGYGRLDAFAALNAPVPSPTASPTATPSGGPTPMPTPTPTASPSPTPSGPPPDTTAPAASVPTIRILPAQTLGSTLNVRVAWAASSDPSGIARYDLIQSTNGGSWTPVTLPSATALSVDLALTPGNTYEFGLRATDGANNTGGYATTTTAKLAKAQETNAAVTYTSGWSRVSLTGASGGAVKKSTTTAATATFKFTGSGVGFVSALGASRGIAEIWLDNAKVATVDLYASATQAARVVWASGVLANTSHTLAVRVTGTKNGSATNVRIDVDAFVRWS